MRAAPTRAARRIMEVIMTQKRSRPPRWFVPAILMGSVAAGGLMAAVIGSIM